jgi:tetratricopeptide (TPR) repeat protein
VPLEPGTLSTLAQQPTLSSAFAELSNLQAQSATPEQSIVPAQPVIPEQPAASVAPSPPLSAPPGQTQPESWWADTLHQMATGSAAEQPISSDPAPTQVPEPVLVNPATDVPQGAPLFPGYRADALLENELETTMRRPAIRLQPVHLDAPSTPNRGRGDKAQEGNLSNKERLLRGYQFQLAGAYDDAMQEYRIIIRNAPELLDEIISNVRALLKLAPKYSAGFRVLGDAYMRHGEYLQAMEAYNKALTIAKKAKSQSN